MLNDLDMTQGPERTGRTLVLLREDAADAAADLTRLAGVSAVRAQDAGDAPAILETVDADAIVYDELGVAVVQAAPDQVRALQDAVPGDNVILAVEAERIVHALEAALPSGDYLRGFRDAAAALAGSYTFTPGTQAGVAAFDETQATWGLQATGVLASTFSGKGVNVAVLDTGMDVGHPDFAGRDPVTRSFVAGEPAVDGHGHGTHCIGTSCGPKVPGQLPRYGIAYEAKIHAGKVLSNAGSGSDQGILAGIEWAIAKHCRVVSMSLGAQIPFGTPFSEVFEAVGRRALKRRTLIVAAAGNNRGAGPVNHPANCPSILAVGALDAAGQIAPFSCRSDAPDGKVDIAAPGVAVRSTWPMPTGYRTISGTSMATPHVAGIAALISEARDVRGLALWGLLTESARGLELPSLDVGAGMVQAP